MKKLFLVIAFLLAFGSFVLADDFELIENSVYKYNEGIIYAIRNNTLNRTSVLYGKNNNYAQILHYDLIYNSPADYFNIIINLNNTKKRKFSQNSQIVDIQNKLLSEIDTYKKCPKNICKPTNATLINHYRDEFLKLDVDSALKTYVSDYKVKKFIKDVKKTVKHNLKTIIPDSSYKIVLTFQINTNDGSVEDFKIVNSKALTKKEEKAYKKAIAKSQPFDVPKEITRVYDVISIKMPFKWNVRTFY